MGEPLQSRAGYWYLEYMYVGYSLCFSHELQPGTSGVSIEMRRRETFWKAEDKKSSSISDQLQEFERERDSKQAAL